MFLDDTIAAVSTPRGKGGVAMIRISGEEAFEICAKVFKTAKGTTSASAEPRHAYYGVISTPAGEVLDSGVMTAYKAPASYTGENMVELCCHGGAYVTRSVLSAVLSAGARAAEAGEFTRRAFINGKLTLTEAEAVGELLEADTEERMKLSTLALSGGITEKLEGITKRLTRVMSALYAAIDYPEEDIGDEGEKQIGAVISQSLSEAERLLSTYKRGRAVSNGVKCVICGKPNAGKSSLYNLILGEESAIVTDIAGTTRDVLRQRASFGGVTLELCDTAGLRDTSDSVESIGVRRAKTEMESAELLIAVFDSSVPLTPEEREMIDSYPDTARIAVINKGDLVSALEARDAEYIRSHHNATVYMSCETGAGADELASEIGRLYDAGEAELGRDPVIWSARQEAMLKTACEYLVAAERSLEYGDPVDAVCTLCESAVASLAETDGRGVSEEVVAGIFSHFCVGK